MHVRTWDGARRGIAWSVECSSEGLHERGHSRPPSRVCRRRGTSVYRIYDAPGTSKTQARTAETKSRQTSWLTASGVLSGFAESLIKTVASSAATCTHAPASHLLLRTHSKPHSWLESTCPPRVVTGERPARAVTTTYGRHEEFEPVNSLALKITDEASVVNDAGDIVRGPTTPIPDGAFCAL